MRRGARAQYNKEYFYHMGRTFMMNDDYREAIRTLNTLLRFDADAYEGYFLRGIAKYNLDDLLGAEADFSLALSKNPVFTQAYTYRAITRSQLGSYDDALGDFAAAIELRPDLPYPYYYRGVTRLMNQQFAEAVEDFDRFLRQENKVPDAYINRGAAYLCMSDTLRAYENYDAAIRTNRETPRVTTAGAGSIWRKSAMPRPRQTSTGRSAATRPICCPTSTGPWSTPTPTAR